MGYWNSVIASLAARVFTDNATLDLDDFLTYEIVNCSVSGKTVTLPTPTGGLVNSLMFLVNGSTGNVTYSCSSGFLQGSSVVLPTKTVCLLFCAEVTVGVYKWITLGQMTSGNATTLQGVTLDSTAPTGELIQALLYSTAGTKWEPVTIVNLAAAVTPTPTWATANPTISDSAFRANTTINKLGKWRFSWYLSDCKGTTGLTAVFPSALVPTNVDQIIPVMALVKIGSGAYTSVPAYVNAKDATSGNRILTVLTGTLTNAQTGEVHIRGEHEIS